MLKNYILTAFRNLKRNKTHSLINIIGLSLGILSAILIFNKIQFEQSFDTMHPNLDRFYRLVLKNEKSGDINLNQGMCYPIIDALKGKYSEIEVLSIYDNNIGHRKLGISKEGSEDKLYLGINGNEMAFVHPEYLELTHNEWIAGDRTSALSQPYTTVLSLDKVKAFFGYEADQAHRAIGQTIDFNQEYQLTVVGVMGNPLINSTFPPHMLISFENGKDSRMTDEWGSFSTGVQCYMRLKDGVDPKSMEAVFTKLTKSHYEDDQWSKHFFLQPVSEAHFSSDLPGITQNSFSKEATITLFLVATFILLAAIINFVNLNTALIFKRAKEVGIRKTLGGSRREITVYFLIETFLITIISTIIALSFVNIIADLLVDIIGDGGLLDIFNNPYQLPIILGLALIVSLGSGLYPAWLMGSFNPSLALKNKLQARGTKGFNLRKSLIIVQFAISQFLIIITLIIYSQMSFFLSQPLGFDKDQILEFDVPKVVHHTSKISDADNDDLFIQDLKIFKNELKSLPFVKNVTYSNTGSASGSVWSGGFDILQNDSMIEHNANMKFIYDDFFETFGVTILEGPTSQYSKNDTAAKFYVNETLLSQLGYEQAHEIIDSKIDMWGMKGHVVGVVKDFATTSFKNPQAPLILVSTRENFQMASIKLAANSPVKESIAQIEDKFNTVFPNEIFDAKFLDESIENFYEAEKRLSIMFQLFAGVAILIGCIGLYGLVSFMAARKTKEIGVRKVFGAKMQDIMAMFGKEFVVLIVIGFLIAAPLSWYAAQQWLMDYPNRIEVGPLYFLAAITFTMVIATITVAFKTWSAARANPIQSLQDE